MENILSIEDLKVRISHGRQNINAVNGLNLSLSAGEILGLVGESGSGKTISALSITRILPESARIISGKIQFEGKDLLRYKEEELCLIRGGKISYIFQEATASLNPVLTVGRQILETIMLHTQMPRNPAYARALELIDMVRLPSPERILRSYPHQLSGGMNQRVMMAIALASNPSLLIADEPTTALDVTVEKEVIQMLLNLKVSFGFSILFITHNLHLVKKFATRIAIMYEGKIVEEGPVADIFERPKHRHTQDLVSSII